MKFKKTEVFNFEGALRGMRNPLESWDKSDSKPCAKMDCDDCQFDGIKLHDNDAECNKHQYIIGKNDLNLAQKLILAGNEHAKFMRMIHVCVDVDMPRYWWSEMDTYGFNTKNSCSTMHRLLNNTKPITKKMFVTCKEDDDITDAIITRLELLRQQYKETKDYNEQTRLLVRAKRLLPEGFLQLRTLDTNYAELRNIYFQRRNHRLKEEWVDAFCKWIETLPYAKELIMLEDK